MCIERVHDATHIWDVRYAYDKVPTLHKAGMAGQDFCFWIKVFVIGAILLLTDRWLDFFETLDRIVFVQVVGYLNLEITLSNCIEDHFFEKCI